MNSTELTSRLELWVLDERHCLVPETDILLWGRWMEGDAAWVGDDTVQGCRVATRFAGLDMNRFMGRPQLFETTIFGGPLHMARRRYATWDEAEHGHAHAVRAVHRVMRGRPAAELIRPIGLFAALDAGIYYRHGDEHHNEQRPAHGSRQIVPAAEGKYDQPTPDEAQEKDPVP